MKNCPRIKNRGGRHPQFEDATIGGRNESTITASTNTSSPPRFSMVTRPQQQQMALEGIVTPENHSPQPLVDPPGRHPRFMNGRAVTDDDQPNLITSTIPSHQNKPTSNTRVKVEELHSLPSTTWPPTDAGPTKVEVNHHTTSYLTMKGGEEIDNQYIATKGRSHQIYLDAGTH